jgi:hypothetical protein
MKRILLIAATALIMPLTTLANSLDFTHVGGTLSGGSAGLTLFSTLTSLSDRTQTITGDLGILDFSTGLTFGSLQSIALFVAGGTFIISGDGTNDIHNRVIVSGTFSGPVSWSLLTAADGTNYYALSGSVSGTWYSGSAVNGAFVALTLSTGEGSTMGSWPSIAATPL